MPNWSSVSYAVHGDEQQLLKFFLDMKIAQSSDPWFKKVDSSWHENWAGNIFLAAGYTQEETMRMHCRGSISNIYYDKDKKAVYVDLELAWNDNKDDFDMMLAEKYPGLDEVMLEEECGCEIYINTDSSDYYFDTRYNVYLFAKDKTTGEEIEDTMYFSEAESDKILDLVRDITGITKYKSVHDIILDADKIDEKVKEDNEDYNFYIHTYEAY